MSAIDSNINNRSNIFKAFSESKLGFQEGWAMIMKQILANVDDNDALKNLRGVSKKFKELIDSHEMDEVKFRNSEKVNLLRIGSEEKGENGSGLEPILKQIFSQADNTTLSELRRVSKRFKEVIDSKEMNEVKLKNLEKDYKLVKMEFEINASQLSELRNKKENVEKELEEESLFGALVSKLNTATGLHLFPAAGRKAKRQKLLNNQYSDLSIQYMNTSYRYRSAVLEELKWKNRYEDRVKMLQDKKTNERTP